MRKQSTGNLLVTTATMTVTVTALVIFAWEMFLMPPFFSWVEATYPGAENAQFRWKFEQRVEHFFISAAVDVFVVTLLMRVVGRQQRSLAASEARYRALFDHSNDGIGILRAEDRRVIEVNQRFAEIAGAEAAQLVGRRFVDLGWSDADADEAVTLAGLLKGAPAGERELTVRTPSGRALPALVSFDTLTTGAERLVILIVRDLSERRRLEREREAMQLQLFQSSKLAALGQMAAQVAHEVKNPLAGLRLYALHLRSRVSGKLPAEDFAMIDKIADGVERLNGITEQLLDFVRPLRLTPKKVSVVRVAEKVLDLLEAQADASKVEIARDFNHGEAVAALDETTIFAALFNLSLNAVQAMPGGGTLSVSVREDDGGVRVRLADTGEGMPAEVAERAFEPFYTTKSKGLGLGLPLAKKIVEEHGGAIEVESRSGAGTRISITLPKEGKGV